MPNVKTSRTVSTTDPRARSTSVPISRLIQTTSPLTGGGSLYNDLTLGIDTSSFGDVFTATRNVFTGYNTLSDTLVKGDIQVSGNTEVYGQSRTDWVTTSGYVGTYDQVVAVAGTVLHGGSSISSIVDAVGVRGSVVNSGGGTITNAYGGWFGVQYYPSGVTTTAYGVYIDTVSGSVGYGLYQGGTQPNVLGGALYHGSVAAGTRFVTSGELTTTVTNPVAGLQISGGALIVYSDNTNPPTVLGDSPTRGLVIGDQWVGQRFYGLGGEVANTGYRWLLYGSGSIAGRLNITANDIGDTVTVGIPVSVSATANIIARSNMQVSGTLIAYKGIYIKDQTPSPNPLGTYFDGAGHWLLLGSGTTNGSITLAQQQPTDVIRYQAISTQFISSDVQISGSTLQIYNNQGAGQDYFFRSTADANGVSWALTGSGSITGRLAIQQLLPGDGATLSNYPLYVDGSQLTVGDGALKVLSDSTTRIEGGLQISGATNIAYTPIHQGVVSAANRYVISGELGGGTGTVTSVVAGRGLTVDPNPITTTGTVGLSDVINFYQDQGLQFQGMAGSTGKIISDPAAEGGGFAGISYALYGSGILQGRLRLNVNQPRDNIITTMPIFHASTAAANRYVISGELKAGSDIDQGTSYYWTGTDHVFGPSTTVTVSGTARFGSAGGTKTSAAGDVQVSGTLQVYGTIRGAGTSPGILSLEGGAGAAQLQLNATGPYAAFNTPVYAQGGVAGEFRFLPSGELSAVGGSINQSASYYWTGTDHVFSPSTVVTVSGLSRFGSSGNTKISAAGAVQVSGAIRGYSTLDADGIISAGYKPGGGEIRSYQNAADIYYVALKTDVGAAKSGIFRSNTDFFCYYDTSTGNTVLDATFAGSSILMKDATYQGSVASANRYIVSGELTAGTIVARDTTQIEWVNTRAEQLAVEYSVPAGALTQTRGYRVVAAGALRGSAAAGIVPVVRYGGQALVSGQISTAAGGNPPGSAWNFTCDLLATHASNAQAASAMLTIGGTATASGVFAPLVTHGLATNPNIAIDSTLVQPLTATVALGAASTDASALLYYAYVERF